MSYTVFQNGKEYGTRKGLDGPFHYPNGRVLYYDAKAGEFDIEWAQDVVYGGPHPWHTREMAGFRTWLARNGFEVDNTEYNYGYHSVGQVQLKESFGTDNYKEIWPILSKYLDIYKIEAGTTSSIYDYAWTDSDYYQQQINMMRPGYDFSSRG